MSLLQSITKYLAEKRCGIRLPVEQVREIIERHGAGLWFLYAFASRVTRWHVCEPSLWVQRHLPKNTAIFETGCGCGLNLIWFAQKGFTSLKGSDISREAIQAGRELALLAHGRVELWQDDGLAPSRLPEQVDLLLALNWTYHVEEFDLGTFLVRHAAVLSDRGYLIIDVIDSCYDSIKNNQYLTSDWDKPVAQRGATEYKKRYSDAQVRQMGSDAGFEICRTIRRAGEVIPRVVYILRKK